MPNQFSVSAHTDNTAAIYIYGDIGESWNDETVTARKFVEEINTLKADLITVRINSYGGSVTDGLAIYNAIKRHPAAIQVEVDGIAASIASLIAMAGDAVYMAENALLMIHAPWSMAIGNSVEMRQIADVLDKYAASMTSAYAAKTGRPKNEFLSLLTDGKDHWYSAAEAIEAGFADEVTAELPIAARYRQDAAQRHPSFPQSLIHEEIRMSLKKEERVKANAEIEAAQSEKHKAEAELDPAAIRAEAVREETQRRADIKAKFRKFGHWEGAQAVLEACLDDIHCTAQIAGERLLAHMSEGAEPVQGMSFIAGADERDKFIEGNTNALLASVGMAPQDRSNPYRGSGIRGVGTNCLKRVRAKIDGLHPEEYAHFALSRFPVLGAQTTSAFPVILENTMHKILITSFQAIPTTWPRIVKIGDVTDLRIWNRLIPGMMGNLDGVNEAGEYINKVIPDGVKNPIQATRKGNIVQITPEVFINDDMGYVRDLVSALGAAGSRAIERAVYAYLESNPTMSDGIALFHADHDNLASSGTALSVDNLDAARVAMAQQKTPGLDAEYLDIRPAIALVNTANEGNLKVIVGAQYDPDTANKLQRPNKVNGIVQDIVSTPRMRV